MLMVVVVPEHMVASPLTVAVGAGAMVNIAWLDVAGVAGVQVPLTTHLYLFPFNAEVAPVTVKVAVVTVL